MGQSFVVSSEPSTTLPVLIIDREGSVGLALYSALREHTQVVLVGGREPVHSDNLLFLAFKQAIPEIPEDAYSHIFFLPDSEKELDDLLSACEQKAVQDNAKLLLILRQDLAQKNILEKLPKRKEVVPIVLGDVFGNPYGFFPGSYIEKLFYTAKKTQALHLSNMGLSPIYPILFDDIVVELLKIAFGNSSQGDLIYLSMSQSVTAMNIAHTLQRADPLIKIDFSQVQETQEEFSLPGVYTLPSQYPVFEKLRKAYKEYKPMLQERFIQEHETKNQEPPVLMPSVSMLKEESEKTSKSAVWFVIVAYIVLVIFLPLLATALFTALGVLGLTQAEKYIQQGSVLSVKQPLLFADRMFELAATTEKALNWETGLVHGQQMVYSLTDAIATGQTISKNGLLIFTAGETVKDVLQGRSTNTKNTLSQALQDIQSAVISLEKIATHQTIPEKQRATLKKNIAVLSPLLNLSEGIPTLMGMDSPKTYLLLFQNNMELRPGGGFIGSYGIVTVDKGKIVGFHIQDVYDADGQLKGHIEPPFAIRRYIPLVHLYLRDSNFDVDFTKNAYNAAYLLQQETGQKVDGVIGVDLSFVKRILASVGSVYVATYNETVTADNLFTLAENHAEKNFFPGSTQKKDFLRSLYEALQAKLASQTINYVSLSENILQAIKEKHVLIAVSDQAAQDLFTLNGFSSALWDPRSQKENTINDFFGMNEANIGVNKVNYYVSRSVDQQVSINDLGNISGVVTIAYNNKSDGTWPGGPYKNYLRILLPHEAQLVKLSIDGQEQQVIPAVTDFLTYEAKNFIAPKGLEVEQTQEQGKNSYGFLITVDPKSTKTITFSYVFTQNVDLTQALIHYNLFLFKQPGIEKYPYSFSLSYPPSFAMLKTVPQLAMENHKLSYVSEETTDDHVDVVLTKK